MFYRDLSVIILLAGDIQGHQLTAALECELCHGRAAGQIGFLAAPPDSTDSSRQAEGEPEESAGPDAGSSPRGMEATAVVNCQTDGVHSLTRHLQPRRRRLRILCLHGFRQSGSSFRGRTAALAKRLAPLAELVFVDAPHPLPFFTKQHAAVPLAGTAANGSLLCNGAVDAGGTAQAAGNGSRQQRTQVVAEHATRKSSWNGCMQQQQAGKLRRAWLLEPCQMEVSRVRQR